MVRLSSVSGNDKEQKNKQKINRSKARGEKNRLWGKRGGGGEQTQRELEIQGGHDRQSKIKPGDCSFLFKLRLCFFVIGLLLIEFL